LADAEKAYPTMERFLSDPKQGVPMLLAQTYSTENVLTGDREGCIFRGGGC
jgi:hypothetical protein